MKRVFKEIKRVLLISIVLLVILFLSPLFTMFFYKDKLILDGYYQKIEYYDKEGFQDYTDYCKYYYKDNGDELFKANSSYQKVSDDDIDNLIGYFDNFKSWMKNSNRSNQYDFDNSLISKGDYFYIKNKRTSEKEKYYDYTLYFYDIESNTLYYMHNNI